MISRNLFSESAKRCPVSRLNGQLAQGFLSGKYFSWGVMVFSFVGESKGAERNKADRWLADGFVVVAVSAGYMPSARL